MGKKLYVGNLSYGVTDETLKGLFAEFGTVESAQIIMDKYSGRSKGFGFVEMTSDEEAAKAIEGLDGKENDGRTLKVNEARPKTDRKEGGYGGGRDRGGRDRGGRDRGGW